MDGHDDIPFGPPPPERIPLVVPDLTPIPPGEVKRPVRRCQATTKAGNICGTFCLKDEDVCLGHSKTRNMGSAQRAGHQMKRMKAYAKPHKFSKPMTKEELLALLSERMRAFVRHYGDIPTALTEEIICDLARTYAIVSKIDGAEQAAKLGWRMKGAV
jgi:hypothetical protein